MAEQFQRTRWSLLRQTFHSDPGIQELAWEEVHQLYREPLERFVCSRGWSAADAEDLVQSFFVKLAHRDWIREADPELGKMRTFLLGRLQNHLREAGRRAKAQKRGGEMERVDLQLMETDGVEICEVVPEPAFDREWARSIFERSLENLRTEFENKGKREFFIATHGVLIGESLPPIADLAEELDTTEGALNVALHRMRHRFRDILRAEVSETLGPDEDLTAELRHLAAAL